jgi:tRNA(adenine34) deaminase
VGAPVSGPGFAGAMGLALELAAAAAERGDVPVGAVVLDPDGAVVASAANERELLGDPLAHAEILALRRAAEALGGWRLDGCTLVVTLEPCAMCAGAITQSRVSRLVFGAFDPRAGAVASLWDLLRDPRLPHRAEVVSGLRAADSERLLADFFAARR